MTKGAKEHTKADNTGSALVGRGGMGLVPFEGDINYPLCDINLLWNPASSAGLLEVSSTSCEDGLVEVSLTIPEGLLKSFTQLLGSMEGFFTHVSWKTHVAKEEARAHSFATMEKRRRFTEAFTAEVLNIFDGLIKDGVPVKEAISATNRAMKEREHPYACYDLVYRELQKAGRFRRKNRTGKPL